MHSSPIGTSRLAKEGQVTAVQGLLFVACKLQRRGHCEPTRRQRLEQGCRQMTLESGICRRDRKIGLTFQNLHAALTELLIYVQEKNESTPGIVVLLS